MITFRWLLKGDALAALGHVSEANIWLRTALGSALDHGEKFLLWRIHYSLGRNYHNLNQEKKAIPELQIARKHIETLGSTVHDPLLRENFLNRANRMIERVWRGADLPPRR